MILSQAIQTRDQAIHDFETCESCDREIHEIPPSPGSPRRFNFIVVRWQDDPDDHRLVCKPCIRLYEAPSQPFRFYS